MSVALSDSMPIRVSSGPLAPGAVVRGHEGFMKLNMQLDFANRSPNGRKLSVVRQKFWARRCRPRRRDAVQFLSQALPSRRWP